MKAISTGNDFTIYDDSLKTYEQLPAQSYRVCFSERRGFFLTKYVEPDAKEDKIYGDHTAKVTKVMQSYMRSQRNLGVILSGAKGIGKTLFAKLLGAEAIKNNLPLIVVDHYIPGIANYLEAIEQECMVFFDEFDKTFGGVKQADGAANPQTEMLALFDGIAGGKKLFVVTCNETNRLSDYLVNRPGRFHYHFRFDYPNPEEITTYLKDKLPETSWKEIDDIIAFASRVPLNYDCLRAIAFELADGSTFKDAAKVLNIVNTSYEEYNVTIVFKNGKTLTDKNVELDLYSEEEVDEDFRVRNEGWLCEVCYNPNVGVFDPMRMATIIPGEHIEMYRVRTAEERTSNTMREWLNTVAMGVDHIEIRRCKAVALHYAV